MSTSSMDWKAACKAKGWGHANPLLWSSFWGETAHHISNCYSYASIKGDCRQVGQREGTGAWAPVAHIHELTDVLLRFSFHKTAAQNQFDSLNPNGLRAKSCIRLHSWAWGGQAKSSRGFTTFHGNIGRTTFQSLLLLQHTASLLSSHFHSACGEVGNNSPHLQRAAHALSQLNATWHLVTLCPGSGAGGPTLPSLVAWGPTLATAWTATEHPSKQD